MPTWLILLLATGPILGLIYCLAMWDAKRDCRACRVAFYISVEAAGGWLLFSGWSADSKLQFAIGSVVLLILNLFLGLRYLVGHLGSRRSRQETGSQDIRAAQSQDKGLAVVVGSAAVTAAHALPPDAAKPKLDDQTLPTDEGLDLDLDL